MLNLLNYRVTQKNKISFANVNINFSNIVLVFVLFCRFWVYSKFFFYSTTKCLKTFAMKCRKHTTFGRHLTTSTPIRLAIFPKQFFDRISSKNIWPKVGVGVSTFSKSVAEQVETPNFLSKSFHRKLAVTRPSIFPMAWWTKQNKK